MVRLPLCRPRPRAAFLPPSLWGDFNGDGNADLVVANADNDSVTILLGVGDGTFTPGVASPATGSLPYSIAVGDFNGDGKADLMTSNVGSNTAGRLGVLWVIGRQYGSKSFCICNARKTGFSETKEMRRGPIAASDGADRLVTHRALISNEKSACSDLICQSDWEYPGTPNRIVIPMRASLCTEAVAYGREP
jgi:hypothetical protein